MKLLAVLLFSTLIWPSPFIAPQAKKIHPVTSEHISAKILYSIHGHVDLLTYKHV
jgi:hypothetical protein